MEATMKYFTIKQRTIAAEKLSNDYEQGWDLFLKYEKALKNIVRVNDFAYNLLTITRTHIFKEKTALKEDISLVEISPEELGLANGELIEMKKIIGKAQELGFKACPFEIGPEIILQGLNEENKYKIIGMDPVGIGHPYERHGGFEDVFIATRYELTSLWAHNPSWHSSKGLVVDANMKFIFAV
jgi:hypothetical protein